MYRTILILILSVVSIPLHAATAGTNNSGFDLGVGFFVNANLVVTSYYEGDELRATFSYQLADVSYFNSQSLDGWMHLDVAQNYDLNQNEHEVRVGLTSINPQEVIGSALWTTVNGTDLPEYLSWYVSTDGLLAGSAGYHRGEFPDQSDGGDLNISDSGIFLCIECGFDMTLNLLFMDFTDGTLGLNFSDEGQGILVANDFFDGNEPYGFDLNLSTAAVPIPAAWLLLGSALALLARRRRNVS